MTWESIIERYNLEVTWQGLRWRGPCPIHGGDNATSFVISSDTGLFHCFSCTKGGDAATFLRLMGDEAEAEKIEAMPRVPALPPPPMEPTAPLAPLDPTHPYFMERGIHEATARHFGIGYFRGTPPFGRRIVAPLHDAVGTLVGHIGRAIDEGISPRYLFQRGVRRSELLFNLHRVKRSGADTVVVVEGIFDALAVHQVGVSNVVSTLGCEVTENQRALLSRFRRILVLFDADPAGLTAAQKLEREFGRAVLRLELPKADPASLKGVLLERVIRGAEKTADATSRRVAR